MWLSCTDQQEMFKNLLEFVLLDPVFLVFMFDLNKFLILGCFLCFYYFE